VVEVSDEALAIEDATGFRAYLYFTYYSGRRDSMQRMTRDEASASPTAWRGCLN
jgi:hypothetical protein